MERLRTFVLGPRQQRKLKDLKRRKKIFSSKSKQSTSTSPPDANNSEIEDEKKQEKITEQIMKVSLAPFYYPPPITIQSIAENGFLKCHARTWDQTLLLGVHSGLCIGLGAGAAFITAYGCPALIPGYQGIAKAIFGMVFPLGLLLLTFTGGELFTGNIMTDLFALYCGKCGILGLLRNWFFAYLGNLIGTSSFVFWFLFLPMFQHEFYSGSPSFWIKQANGIATIKVTKPFWSILLQGIAANWSVGIAVWCCSAIHDVAGKILALWCPIFAFAVLGYEHCVANSATLAMGYFFRAENVSLYSVFYNLFYATIGNIIGSGFLLAGLLWYCHTFRDSHKSFGIFNNLYKFSNNLIKHRSHERENGISSNPQNEMSNSQEFQQMEKKDSFAHHILSESSAASTPNLDRENSNLDLEDYQMKSPNSKKSTIPTGNAADAVHISDVSNFVGTKKESAVSEGIGPGMGIAAIKTPKTQNNEENEENTTSSTSEICKLPLHLSGTKVNLNSNDENNKSVPLGSPNAAYSGKYHPNNQNP